MHRTVDQSFLHSVFSFRPFFLLFIHSFVLLSRLDLPSSAFPSSSSSRGETGFRRAMTGLRWLTALDPMNGIMNGNSAGGGRDTAGVGTDFVQSAIASSASLSSLSSAATTGRGLLFNLILIGLRAIAKPVTLAVPVFLYTVYRLRQRQMILRLRQLHSRLGVLLRLWHICISLLDRSPTQESEE